MKCARKTRVDVPSAKTGRHRVAAPGACPTGISRSGQECCRTGVLSVVDQWWQCQNHHGPTKIPRPIPIAIMISLRISGGVLIIHGRATEVSRFLPCLSFPGVSGDRLRGVLTFGERNRRIRRDGPVAFPIRWSARSGRRMSIARRSRFAGHHLRRVSRTVLVGNMIRSTNRRASSCDGHPMWAT